MLKCRENGDFVILVTADPQCEEAWQWNEAGAELETLVARAEPDFVLINGDMETRNNIPADGWAEFIRPLTLRGIPWSTTNGNHDPFRVDINDMYMGFTGCMNSTVDAADEFFEPERPLNYVLPVYSHDGQSVVFAVYGMDSGDGGYPDWEGFTEKQIAWYRRNSEALKKQNGGKPVTSLVCCHIPFDETRQMQVLDGVINEDATFTAAKNNRGFFECAREQGDMKIAVFGHSHQINRIGLYKDVLLGYAGKLSTGSYHDEFARGGRVVKFSETAPEKFATCWLAVRPDSKDQKEVRLCDLINK